MSNTKISLAADQFTVALDRLTRDPGNVRRTEIGAEIEALANDIAAHGLLHNLGVRANPEAGEGRFFVSIGGRRLAALKHLVKTKRLAKNTPIPCRLLADDEATSAGLAENLSRVAMHPADAFEAFAALIDQGKTVDDVALRFGISAQTVERRLRLGRLSPVILAAFRAGTIDEEDAKAFAITTDHAAQDRVFAELGDGRTYIDPHRIKRKLTEGEVPSHDRRARLVGLEAYEAAGGTIRRDLFAEWGNGSTLVDVDLLGRLALAKLQEIGETVRAEGWADVRVQVEEPESSDFAGFAPAQPIKGEPSDADRARLAEIEEARTAFEQLDEMNDEQDEALSALIEEENSIEARATRYAPEDTAQGRVMVWLSGGGDVQIWRAAPVGEAVTTRQGASGRAAVAREGEETASGLTGALTASLLGARTRSLQAHVADNPGLALRLLAQSLLMNRGYDGHEAPLRLTLHRPVTLPHDVARETEDGTARKVLDDAHERREDHQPGDTRSLLPWLLAMDDSQVVDLLAPLLAEGIDAHAADWNQNPDSIAAQAACAASYDPSAYWTPTAETYFGRVNKQQIAEAVREVGETINPTAKKAELAAEAERKTAGTGWVPMLMRLPDNPDKQAA